MPPATEAGARGEVASSRSATLDSDPDREAALARYIEAWERADSAKLIALLRDDAKLAMPPLSDTFAGAAAIDGIVFRPAGPGAFRFVRIEANGSPALAMYQRHDDGAFHAASIHVLETAGGRAPRSRRSCSRRCSSDSGSRRRSSSNVQMSSDQKLDTVFRSPTMAK